MVVVGARPQFIKSAPIIHEIIQNHEEIRLHIVHSGQHYDSEMSAIFFRELQIPRPSMNLQTGSGSHATQTATIMTRLEPTILRVKPRLVIAPGDTNTTLAAAITAAKLGIPVAHVEAGLRSGDIHMPEEINRRLTDHCSTLAFAPTKTAVANLNSEGLRSKVYFAGDTMVDAMETVLPYVQGRQNAVLEQFKLNSRQYVLVTLHRPSNVDDNTRLRAIFEALHRLAKRIPIIFPVHPRTLGRLRELGEAKRKRQNVKLTIPQGYIESLSLLKNAACLVTDSGGMQKESFIFHIPCITLRPNTEWPETLRGHANRLVTNPRQITTEVIQVAFDEQLRNKLNRLRNPFGDGHASARIARALERYLRNTSDVD
jgi:UDP-N-acetylglucosamine 2-epimerase